MTGKVSSFEISIQNLENRGMKRQKVFQLGILKYCWGNNWSKNGIQREAYLHMHISIFHWCAFVLSFYVSFLILNSNHSKLLACFHICVVLESSVFVSGSIVKKILNRFDLWCFDKAQESYGGWLRTFEGYFCAHVKCITVHILILHYTTSEVFVFAERLLFMAAWKSFVSSQSLRYISKPRLKKLEALCWNRLLSFPFLFTHAFKKWTLSTIWIVLRSFTIQKRQFLWHCNCARACWKQKKLSQLW